MTDRPGNTELYSISVSKEFSKLVNQYKLSPTEVFRKGMAVCLYELDIDRYQTETNRKRLEFTRAFMDKYNKDKELIKLFDDILSLGKIIEEIKKEDEKKD